MKMFRHGVACLVALTFAAGVFSNTSDVSAATVNYSIISSGSGIDGYGPPSPDGLEVLGSTLFSTENFTLDDNDWHEFYAFRIWTPETAVNWDDFNPQPIVATLNFELPVDTDVNIGGTTTAVTFFGLVSAGAVTWNAPTTIEMNGYHFVVSLLDEVFNAAGGLNFTPGEDYGVKIKAKVKQKHSPDPVVVPLPPAAMAGMSLLVGTGLLRQLRRIRKPIAI